ncbi:unnamed protein product [Candida verbasci]|uniref:F-box domain-containing protein n=1 Tax=Candida verbasci TaxID=1227364 RepID=A0A9W4XFD9_9ASCO|nr:unnamed protein product [Candida verbasci]
MVELIDLPSHIKSEIIKYLPQQSVFNLALTNFEFYEPCIRQLYKTITIQIQAPLRPHTNLRNDDFSDCTSTILYGFDKMMKKETNLKMIFARLIVLIQSLRINSQLRHFINEINVVGECYNDNVIEALQDLINELKSLKKFNIESYKIRRLLDLKNLKLESVVVDNEIEYEKSIKELIIGENQFQEMSQFSTQLSSLILPNDKVLYWDWIKNNIFKNNLKLPSIEKFKFVFALNNFENNERLVSILNWSKIKQLELIFDYTSSQDCIIDVLNLIPTTPNLTHLSISQSEIYSTHAENEIYDLNIFNFLNNSFPKLIYLSISHKVPDLGNFVDGVEGNYFRRLNLYINILPTIIQSLNNKITLELSNLFQTFACYEQYMNTVLWNGCKCSHCEVYLGKLDTFLMYHKYFNNGRFRDMNVSHLFSEIGYRLSKREIWNFHKTQNGKGFKCCDTKVIDQGEYDEEDFDNKVVSDCEFNEVVYKGIPTSVSHYLNSLVIQILKLYRGNAEGNDVEFNDGGDEQEHELMIRRIIINGIVYNLDKELNGTHFYENVYD